MQILVTTGNDTGEITILNNGTYFQTQELPTEFKKPRVCKDGHDEIIYDADFFGGPGERSCPICEGIKASKENTVKRIRMVIKESTLYIVGGVKKGLTLSKIEDILEEIE